MIPLKVLKIVFNKTLLRLSVTVFNLLAVFLCQKNVMVLPPQFFFIQDKNQLWWVLKPLGDRNPRTLSGEIISHKQLLEVSNFMLRLQKSSFSSPQWIRTCLRLAAPSYSVVVKWALNAALSGLKRVLNWTCCKSVRVEMDTKQVGQ